VRGWMLRQAQHERQKACPEEFRGPERVCKLEFGLFTIIDLITGKKADNQLAKVRFA
jgi:hypothetical protein